MSARIRARLTFANVISLIALFVALGGTGYAAIKLPKNSVTSKTIKKGAVTNAKLGKNAVTSSKVKDGSLLKTDFATGQLPAGPQGAQGIQGPPGTNGTNGTNGTDGAQGVPGEAVAYARVGSTGTIDAGTPTQNKNVIQDNVEHDGTTGTGVYCFGGLSFTPHSAIVTADSAGAFNTTNVIVSVAVQRGNNLGNCDATHQQARVSVLKIDDAAGANGNVAPALADHGFYIWFE